MPIVKIPPVVYSITQAQSNAVSELLMMHQNPGLYKPLPTRIPGFSIPNPNIPTINFEGGPFKAYKSTLLAELMFTYAEAGFRTLLAIKEESVTGMAKRTLSRGTRIGDLDMKNMVSRTHMRNINLSNDDFVKMNNTILESNAFPLFVTDDAESLDDLFPLAEANGVQVVGLDYFTLFQLDNSKARTPREMFVEMSHYMVSMKQKGITSWIAYQVDETSGKGKETRVMYDDADLALQLSRCKDSVTDEIDPHKLRMDIVAAREGATGKFDLYVDGQYNLIMGQPQQAAKGAFLI